MSKNKIKRGRPTARVIRIEATASEIAKSIFRAAKKPDPSIRITKKQESQEKCKRQKYLG